MYTIIDMFEADGYLISEDERGTCDAHMFDAVAYPSRLSDSLSHPNTHDTDMHGVSHSDKNLAGSDPIFDFVFHRRVHPLSIGTILLVSTTQEDDKRVSVPVHASGTRSVRRNLFMTCK